MTRTQMFKLVKELIWLQPAKQEYIKAHIERYMSGGLTKYEAEKMFIELQRINHRDILTRQDLEKIKLKILGFFV
ncbi:MAG TPA: hypothetical protein VI432_00490 [Candidatus Paceibacterota bacterium]